MVICVGLLSIFFKSLRMYRPKPLLCVGTGNCIGLYKNVHVLSLVTLHSQNFT